MADVAYSPIFESVYEYAKALSMEDANKLLMACCAYAFGDEMPELDGIVGVIFEQTARPSLDKTLATARRSRANGKRRAAQSEPRETPGKSQSEPTPEPNQSQSEPTANPEGTQTEATTNPDQTQSEPRGNPETT